MYKPNDISVIVPCYNEKESIARCIHSISNQTVKPFEIIFVNNNSTDDTVAKIKDKVEMLKLSAKIVHESKKGIPFARNTGIKNANGKIIVFLDADCVAPTDYIQLILEDFNASPVQAVTGKYILVGQDSRKAAWRQRAWSNHFGWDNQISIVRSLQNQNGTLVSGCSAFLKSTLEKLGYYDERFVFMDDVALSEKFYRHGYTSIKDGRIQVTHNIDTSESVILKKDYRYGKDRALIYKYSENKRFKLNTEHYTRITNAFKEYARVRDKYYLYEVRTLLYFKLGLLISGLKNYCIYI